VRRRTHIIDPDHFVATRRLRPWCGAFGGMYSPMVEHPDDADCQRCLAREAAEQATLRWEANRGARA
jgi:hypothetical protein